ncbi:hypothetical protein DPMN_042830 [Dreissena polymorpha]|uniref:Uncharacterized protein n=1 Tax=Dreissena polymorpha TaxID=45954 RepID=A0A9D4HXB9_DREPO|nr:hypothetical protein DPMN_042830 [Dreissena polymorpha]
MQMLSRWTKHGGSLRDSPRTETPGGSWLAVFGQILGQLERLAQNRDAWRKLVGGLCPRWDHRRR